MVVDCENRLQYKGTPEKEDHKHDHAQDRAVGPVPSRAVSPAHSAASRRGLADASLACCHLDSKRETELRFSDPQASPRARSFISTRERRIGIMSECKSGFVAREVRLLSEGQGEVVPMPRVPT